MSRILVFAAGTIFGLLIAVAFYFGPARHPDPIQQATADPAASVVAPNPEVSSTAPVPLPADKTGAVVANPRAEDIRAEELRSQQLKNQEESDEKQREQALRDKKLRDLEELHRKELQQKELSKRPSANQALTKQAITSQAPANQEPPALPEPIAPTPPVAVKPPPPSGLLIPVEGMKASRLRDTFADSRDNGRVHDAIDIMAPKGTPVIAAQDGRIVKLFKSKAGGLTIYEFDREEKLAYYYAHLKGYAPGVVEGKQVKRGELIGYVGSTGNARADAPHLHFAIMELGPKKRWWEGTAINPYPLLVPK